MGEETRIEMKVEGLVLDPATSMPIIILKDMEDQWTLPIWVGIFEANAIALEMEKIQTPRPMTHDLIKNIFNGFEATVNHICVNDLRDNTFYALISVNVNGEEKIIDSRPSDAIAISLRVNAKILVEKKVLEEAKSFDFAGEAELGNDDQWKKWLDEVKPDDFGKDDQ